MNTFNIPQKPISLLKLKILDKRKLLNQTDQSRLYVLQKGYQGERDFAEMLESVLTKKTIVLYDLFLEWRSSYFQIDCLIICNGKVFLLDIKNYEGNYVYQNENFYSLTKRKTIKNPLHQLKRCKIMLQDMLNHYNFSYTIYAYLVFVHTSFILYQSPTNLDIIHPGQIQCFLEKINADLTVSTWKDNEFAMKMKDKHMRHNPFTYNPTYHIDDLKKGILCLDCGGLLFKRNRKTLQCKKCDDQEGYESAILRMIIEFEALFPNEKLTSRKIYRWIDGFVSMRKISDVMKKYMNVYGHKSATYYKFKEYVCKSPYI